MDSSEAIFHWTVFGIIVIAVIAVSIVFKKQERPQKEKLFHGLYGVLSIGTLILIFVGAMVASTRSGMAFMDWPTSNGLIWPGLDKWVHQKDMFWEHFHRLIAEGIGVLVICALIWSFFVFDKKFVKASAILLLLICVQGYFGGLTVRELTAWWTSTLHGFVAQIVFCYMVVIYYKTSKKVREIKALESDDSWFHTLPKVVCIIVLVQLLLGASFRHKMKVAQFASTISEPQQIYLQKNKVSLQPRKSGEYNVQLKAPASGSFSISLGDRLTVSGDVKGNPNEFVSIGSLSLKDSEEYLLKSSGNISSIKFIGPERIDRSKIEEDQDKELPFVIVYKEVLDGNRHLLWAHIAFALVVTLFVLFLGMYLFKKREEAPYLKTASTGMLIALVIQIFLGLIAFITVNERQKGVYDQFKTILTSAHLANGALLLGFCVLAMFLCRWRFVKTATGE